MTLFLLFTFGATTLLCAIHGSIPATIVSAIVLGMILLSAIEEARLGGRWR